jgi:UDP-N-acetylmuramoylalanine--D-glutamate ligase
VVAITGTNGKTTTTTLTGRIFEDARKPAVVAGNIGIAFSQVVGHMNEKTTAILEVSSFQLDHIERFKPRVAVLLNITPDHLDRYDHSVDRYSAAKFRIFENQRGGDVLIYNHDDEIVRSGVERSVSGLVKRVPFSLRERLAEGAYVEKGRLLVSIDGEVTDIIACDAISIGGLHNLQNAMAATLIGKVMGIHAASLRGTLKNFKGVEHRLEFVRELRGVSFVNDSKGTNIDSVWYALQSFHSPIILVLGGRDKGNDYSRLYDLVKKHVRTIIAIGESASKVEQAFAGIVPVTTATDMEQAVQRSAELAQPGDVVLLSPACASFDWFDNYEHRGRVFKEHVMALGTRD